MKYLIIILLLCSSAHADEIDILFPPQHMTKIEETIFDFTIKDSQMQSQQIGDLHKKLQELEERLEKLEDLHETDKSLKDKPVWYKHMLDMSE